MHTLCCAQNHITGQRHKVCFRFRSLSQFSVTFWPDLASLRAPPAHLTCLACLSCFSLSLHFKQPLHTNIKLTCYQIDQSKLMTANSSSSSSDYLYLTIRPKAPIIQPRLPTEHNLQERVSQLDLPEQRNKNLNQTQQEVIHTTAEMPTNWTRECKHIKFSSSY
jgi:hypothetical protein